MEKYISLDQGGGGKASWELVEELRKILKFKGSWKNISDDGAVFNWGREKLVFTTDSFIIEPIFFPGGDIGKIAACGTINDVAVMGAKPIGISLAMVIEEGFLMEDLKKIIRSINRVSKEAGVPVVTGDTKVSNKGKLDKIEITTAGVGLAKEIIPNNGLRAGDFIVASGALGDHGALILAKRFNYKTSLQTDSQPLVKEIQTLKKYLSAVKDPTRGGVAANIVEMAEKSKVRIILEEEKMPFKKEVLAISNLLGIDPFALPSEGRFIAGVKKEYAKKTVKILKRFNRQACIIGRAEKGKGVFLKTRIGSYREITMPEGKLIPRIC